MKYQLKKLLSHGVTEIKLDTLTYFKDNKGRERCREETNARSAVRNYCRSRNLNYTIEKVDKFSLKSKKMKLIVKLT